MRFFPRRPTSTEQSAPFTQRGFFLRQRQRHTAVDVALMVVDGFRAHKTGLYSALLTHFGFLSLFPLFAALITILGFVLEGNPDLQERIVDSTLTNVPIVGQYLSDDPGSISGNLVVLVLGLATSLWAGTKAFVAAQNAMNEIWEVPQEQRPSFVSMRSKAMIGIAIVGFAQISSGILTGFIGASGKSFAARLLLAVAALIINTGTLMATYNTLTARQTTWRELLPGSMFGGSTFLVLQILTSTLVARALRRAAPLYGDLSGVIALFGWLSLHSGAALIGVEINAALSRRRLVGAQADESDESAESAESGMVVPDPRLQPGSTPTISVAD